MAEIVMGLGTSHGPMLSTPPERWHLRAVGDRKDTEHYFRNKAYDFEALEKLRADENIAAQLDPALCQQRYDACQRAIAKLAGYFTDAKADAAVIVGNDQMEMYWNGTLPALSVYWGDGIENRQASPEAIAKMDPAFLDSVPSYAPPEPAVYPGHPQLGLHILKSLKGDKFDVTSVQKLSPHRGDRVTISHAYGFVFRKIMQDKVIPTVPVIQNTFFPPNQPTVSRCIELGHGLVKAIKSWDRNERVVLIASGGLTHFVIDEELDRFFIDAFATGRLERLETLDDMTFQSGTSELKNWIPVATAMGELGYKMELVDYVPCYRSAAGTGNAMGFIRWTMPN